MLSTVSAISATFVKRSIERPCLDIPESNVDRRDRTHDYGTMPPIGSAIEVLPDVFDLKGIGPNKAWDHVLA
jgi:hypothetical protein